MAGQHQQDEENERGFQRVLARMTMSQEQRRRNIDNYMSLAAGRRKMGQPPPPEDTRLPWQRAQDLFMENLTPEQQRTWRQHGFIQFLGSDGASYVLVPMPSYNVFRLTPRILLPLCAVARADCTAPDHDKYLTQKLLVEVAVEEFLKIAYHSGVVLRGNYSFERYLSQEVPDVTDEVRCQNSIFDRFRDFA